MFDDAPIKEITPEDTQLLVSSLKEGVTDIGGHLIPNTLLEDYKNHVAYLRRVCNLSLSLRDPMITMNALTQREKIHRKIFKRTGLIYHVDDDATSESIQFNTALDILEEIYAMDNIYTSDEDRDKFITNELKVNH